MKKELFNDIMRSIKSFRGLSRDCAVMLIQKYSSVSENTIHSILSEAVLIITKGAKRKMYNSINTCLTRYSKARQNNEPPGILVRMAVSFNVPPTWLARLFLEKYCKDTNKTKDDKQIVSQLMKDTTLIQDSVLAYEIYLCILHDDKSGYISDTFSGCIGYEYEIKLMKCLIERNIPFSDEEQLRSRGYDKTPDFKLEIPIAVDGFIVNWIESKARFGSESVHKTTVHDQCLSYWNRFGTGLVIYWYDFVDTLLQPNEKKFIIMNDFPENITYMDTKISRGKDN